MTKDPYEGGMPDSLFRYLTAREEVQFRKAAREMWAEQLPEGFSVFHPVVRDEWKKIDLEKGVKR